MPETRFLVGEVLGAIALPETGFFGFLRLNHPLIAPINRDMSRCSFGKQ